MAKHDCPELSDHNARKAAHKAAGLDVSGYTKPKADYHSPVIKPENKGKFTAKAKSHKEGVQQFANQVMAHKGNYSPSTVKQANFAKNFGGKK